MIYDNDRNWKKTLKKYAENSNNENHILESGGAYETRKWTGNFQKLNYFFSF